MATSARKLTQVSERPGRVRVVVADDHPLFRGAVVRAVRERAEFELVGEAADGRSALAAIRELEPAVALLDVKMPGLDGLQVLNAVRRDGLATRVILLSAYLDGTTAFEAVAQGAAAFLSKDADHQVILDTDEIRLRGSRSRPGLSPRELEILKHIAAGRSAPEIGKVIHLSPATVKSHLQSLYEKLGVSDRAAAVAEAMRRGLLE